MKLIPLTRGYFAQVDDHHYEWLSQFYWQAVVNKHTVYAKRAAKIDGRIVSRRMHRDILNVFDTSIVVDHRDGNGLNNLESNIRKCTSIENSRNVRSDRGVSKYKGVWWSNTNKKWCVNVGRGKNKHIGCYDTEELAAYAYNVKAKERFGEFALLNDIGDVSYSEESINYTSGHRPPLTGFKYKGVQYHKGSKKWVAVISVKGERIRLGVYSNDKEAAVAFNNANLKYYGTKAFQNKID